MLTYLSAARRHEADLRETVRGWRRKRTCSNWMRRFVPSLFGALFALQAAEKVCCCQRGPLVWGLPERGWRVAFRCSGGGERSRRWGGMSGHGRRVQCRRNGTRTLARVTACSERREADLFRAKHWQHWQEGCRHVRWHHRRVSVSLFVECMCIRYHVCHLQTRCVSFCVA